MIIVKNKNNLLILFTIILIIILIPLCIFFRSNKNNEDIKEYKSIDCPEITNIDDKKLQSELNNRVKEYIGGSFDDINWDDAKVVNNIPEGSGVSWLSVYCKPIINDGAVSAVNVSVSSYGAGAAHPNSYEKIISINDKLALSDLFKPNTDYLKIITERVRFYLNRDHGVSSDWINEGTSYEEDFSNFLVEKEGLKIIFGEYQVAPHSEGIIEVLIPKDELGSDYLY